MDVYIFLRNHVGEVPVVERLPITVYASSDEEAAKKTLGLGHGELFKKIPRLVGEFKKNKNRLLKK